MMILTNTILTLAYAAGSAIAFTGNMTWVNQGGTDCGVYVYDYQRVVALSPHHWPDENARDNCNKLVSITANGKTIDKVPVLLRCPGCDDDEIVVSPGLYEEFQSNRWEIPTLADWDWD